MKSGYYLIARGWMDNPVFSSSRSFDRRSAWIWIIENSAFKDTRQDVLGKTVVVPRGNLICSLKHLVREWNWSEKAVRSFLKRLEKEEMIRISTGLGKTQIYVINYDRYQISGRTIDEARASQGQQKNKGKEGNKIIHMSKDEFRKKILNSYPKRDGGLEITRAYDRIKDQVTKNQTNYEIFFLAVDNYRKECETRGVVGTQYVKQVSTFTNKTYKDYIQDGASDASGKEDPWSPF